MHLVLLETFRKQALQGCPDNLGQMEQMMDLLRDLFLLAQNA